MTPAGALVFGVLSGFRHAFEPDHLAAVSTLVSDRSQTYHAARLGAWWGLGHTLALASVAAVLAVFNQALPPSVEEIFEFLVAMMLLLLGARAVGRSVLIGAHQTGDGHRGWFQMHRHTGLQPHLHVGGRVWMVRPLVIGLVHGLAGSGALTALVMSSLPSTSLRLLYTVLFGLASTAGMMLVSGVAGLSLARVTRSDRLLSAVSITTGLVSVAVGVLWAYPILYRWLAVGSR